MSAMLDLFDWSPVKLSIAVKPDVHSREQWPPNYASVYAWRIEMLAKLRTDKTLLAYARRYYKHRLKEFICHWMDTYNPRLVGNKWVPFILFTRQAELIDFVLELIKDQQSGLIEKCRDIGATWLLCAISVWMFLFWDNEAIGWGSRKEDLVDTLGDPDSIFEKMRLILRRMPEVFMPDHWVQRDNATFMKLTNPDNGSSVTGESGDSIGRGGRKGVYIKDESAHYVRPEKIESALGDNTNVQIDMSSVNGYGNVFHRRREAGQDWQPGKVIDPGITRVFVFDWRDHPEKDQAWYDQRKAKAVREGLQHIFAQEVDRDYSGAVKNNLIEWEWIQAAVDAHLVLDCLRDPPDLWMAGLDVADGGIDLNALALRQGVILRMIDEWGGLDTSVTTDKTVAALRQHKGIVIQYDAIGVGSGVKAEYNRLVREKIITPFEYKFVPWVASNGVIRPFERLIKDDPESILNRDMFGNFKAQAWWSMRTRFYKTWRARVHGDKYNGDELISLDSRALGSLLHKLMKEFAQAVKGTSGGLRMIVDKTPDGTKSPNMADAAVQAYFPAADASGALIVGNIAA